MPQRLHVVISGILAGGILGFRNVDCCFRTFGWPSCFVVWSLLFQMARTDDSTQDAILIHQSTSLSYCPGLWACGFFGLLFSCFCFWLPCAFVFVGFLFSCFFCSRQLDGLHKGPHSLSFVAFSSDGFACFSQFIFGKYKLVERPGESHEGWTEKKLWRFVSFFILSHSSKALWPCVGLSTLYTVVHIPH